MSTADAIVRTLESSNVSDSNGENANIVDSVDRLASCALAISRAIRPSAAGMGTGACGGTIDSLTEAVMGVTGGLCRIAEAIDNLADAVRDGKS